MSDQILRYDSLRGSFSRIDPILDISSWISGLRSRGYVADLLKEKHGLTDLRKINKASKAISSHAEDSMNLLSQGMSGPIETSFLPIYYSLLNLSKMLIIFKGEQEELARQRWHGASYDNRKVSRDLMTEKITLHSRGAIPLFYRIVTNEHLPIHSNHISVRMGDVYRYIKNISHELSVLYKQKNSCEPITINIEGNNTDGYRLNATVSDKHTRASYKVLKEGFHLNRKKHPKGKRVINMTGTNMYVTERIQKTEGDAKKYLTQKYLRRFLISVASDNRGTLYTLTPISSSKLLWLEGLPILLAFFHMSNIVRYNPEFLEQLKDSKAWTILLSLSRQGALCFMELIWSAYQNEHIIISPA